ncbi:hypothetical protein N5B55_10445 [Ralstonia pickettii]|uniref:hypothetical protein n=1 Tax=Ralstonia pickettii TaxID=329 RepID=UPI002714EA99|nr:hypothetical protein [Ralstonia pickettii]WKZ84205.1 hypothetical protein N5B55_10445 [Ralstonia pickettii]
MDQSENRFYRERDGAAADGGPAFPVADRDVAHAAGSAAVIGVTDPTERDRLYADAYNKAVRGMTLRDHFAGLAMQAYIVSRAGVYDRGPEKFDEDLSRWAFETSDAMLRAREAV